ncbi:MAG: type VI secretion system baseplate subunit TssF [Polyangiaceae bacterium]
MEDKTVEKAFLSELESLEKFRISYTGMYPQVPLAREDPDVRRLIEALAFFSARTRVAAERTVNESLLRLFRQHFPFALNPMPAMVMLQGETTARFVDTVEVPRGTEIMVERPSMQARGVFRFRTLTPMRVLPIEIVGLKAIVIRNQVRRIVIQVESAFPRNDEIGTLSLHINHLNDLFASMTVMYAMRTHVTGASIVWSDVVQESTQGSPCEIAYGATEVPSEQLDSYEHPIQQFRSFVHFPQAELFVHLKNVAPPRNWQKFSIVLDLDDQWPIELRLTRDTFALNVVPMINLRRDMANPIECDGTKERYLVTHPDTSARYAPHSFLGVYEMNDKLGMVPIEPGVLGPTSAGYEVSFEGRDEHRRGWVHLDLPGAFEQPKRVAVEGYWMQPGIHGAQADELKARPADRHVEGVKWSCCGAFASPTVNSLEDDRDGLLAMMALKSQRFLSLDDLTFLVRALGAAQRAELARLINNLKSVELGTKPAGRKTSGICYVYRLQFDDLDTSDMPRLDLFCAKLLKLLSSWSIEQVIEIVAVVPRLGKELRYAE